MGLREISHLEIQASFQEDPPTSKLSKMGCLQMHVDVMWCLTLLGMGKVCDASVHVMLALLPSM